MLCFHGLNATRLTFEEVQSVCSKHGFFVVTFDLYGHGLSANPAYRACSSVCGGGASSYGVQFYVEQAEELMAHLNLLKRPHSVIGFSMGGVIASAYAARHKEKVQRVVLISSAGVLGKRPPSSVRALRCCRCCIGCLPSCCLFCCGANCGCCCWSARAVARAKAAFKSVSSAPTVRGRGVATSFPWLATRGAQDSCCQVKPPRHPPALALCVFVSTTSAKTHLGG